MNILFSNDDGIFAPGLLALVKAFSEAGHRAFVSAPDRERSGASHCVSIVRPLRARAEALPGAERAWAVDGMPADCASLGLFLTRDVGIDLVVTGINRGMNQGGACIYSGTVGAALEASMSGVPGLAVSLCVLDHRGEDRNDYSAAARVALKVADWLRGRPMARGTMLNLNVPLLPYEQIKGFRPATLAPVYLEFPCYERVEDGDGESYVFRNGPAIPLDDPDYDVVLTGQGYATLTWLTWDMRLDVDHGPLGEIEL